MPHSSTDLFSVSKGTVCLFSKLCCGLLQLVLLTFWTDCFPLDLEWCPRVIGRSQPQNHYLRSSLSPESVPDHHHYLYYYRVSDYHHVPWPNCFIFESRFKNRCIWKNSDFVQWQALLNERLFPVIWVTWLNNSQESMKKLHTKSLELLCTDFKCTKMLCNKNGKSTFLNFA